MYIKIPNTTSIKVLFFLANDCDGHRIVARCPMGMQTGEGAATWDYPVVMDLEAQTMTIKVSKNHFLGHEIRGVKSDPMDFDEAWELAVRLQTGRRACHSNPRLIISMPKDKELVEIVYHETPRSYR